MEIIDEISKALMEETNIQNSTVNIGTTVTIRGMGGIGKSTLAKALCYHPPIKTYFIHGFLWISLTPPRLSPEAVLRDMYNKLTDNSVTCSYSWLKDKIRLLFSSLSCKILIIFDDVVDAEDVLEYAEIFSSCKTVLTTRKKDINVTIPSKHCFDIGPMKTFQAVELLTWKIPRLVSLNPNDAHKIQELAKDLYYWPLLLNLVRGQLYIHCTEWKQPPTIAVLSVLQKLRDKGLTAFDPKHVKKENAVKASINASLELLSKNENYVLFHIVTGIGIGSCVLKAYILKLSRIASGELDELIESIWSHGLINVGSIKIPPDTVAIPCIEIHDVIAQYIIEDMPYNYHLFLSEIKLRDCAEYFISFCDQFEKKCDPTNIATTALSIIDVIYIPFMIRTLAVITRAVQVEFSKALDSLIERYNEILKTNALTKFLKKKQTLLQIYGFVKENCRTIQSLLNNNQYDEAATWISKYVENHPHSVQIQSICILTSELTHECRHSSELVQLINKTIGACCPHVDFDIDNIGKELSSIIYSRKIISEMIKAGATGETIFEMWNQLFFFPCS